MSETTRTWTVTRTWHGVKAASATDALTAARPGEHDETHVEVTGQACQATTLQALLSTDAEPARCGQPAVARVVMELCTSLDCSPAQCRGHEVCVEHLKQVVEQGIAKHLKQLDDVTL